VEEEGVIPSREGKRRGTYGFVSSMRATPEDVLRKVTSENAARLFGFKLD
jgi:hypothetical protein